MEELKIFFSEDTEEMEMICTAEKGFRWDVVVQIGNRFYEPQYYTLNKLIWSFNVYKEMKRAYLIEPCLILVENVGKEDIIKTTLELHKNRDFFSHFKPVENIDTTKLAQVYPII